MAEQRTDPDLHPPAPTDRAARHAGTTAGRTAGPAVPRDLAG
ncbi:hypothetical protein [Nocardiopsis trehalosi]|nr:hypothetical protein [Nocardiopsis trehalosi]